MTGLASAAIIHGTIYDLSLKKASNARVEINTSPKQFVVAQNGSYSFNAANGAYTIKAYLMQGNSVIASVQENITIKQAGDYVLDLILFPDLDEGLEEGGIDLNADVLDTGRNNKSILAWAAVLAAIALAAAYYFIKKAKRKKGAAKTEDKKNEENEEDPDLEQVTEIIKKEGGRATQKDIRKQIPLSEAKISLMIAELEHKGVIEKIKKGRGNIIILRK